MPSLELTLIVAATRSMGIGAHGTMPWSGLRKEMQYFARVTTRVSPQASTGAINAVIMGRKTWDSIPVKFRPLKGRLNIIVSRSATGTTPPSTGSAAEPVWASSLEQAIQYAQEQPVSRIFVMGGAQIYDAALKLAPAKRVMLTSIDRDFECDTFFPIELGKAPNWVRRSTEELQDWTGEQVAEGGQEEAGTKYEFQMWEKTD